MKLDLLRRLVAVLALAVASPVVALDVTLDTESARAVLGALRDGALSRAEALRIAGLPGNQGLVRKANSYHIPATTETFADALVAAAHGTPSDTPTARNLGFDRLKPRSDALLALIRTIEGHPKEFQAWVVNRVEAFTPAASPVKVAGYLIVGGNSGGFSFDEPTFFLNLNYFDEFEPAKVVLAHELYHAVQAAYAVDDEARWLKPERPTADGRARQQTCANLAKLFANLYQEGSASYVGDPLLIDAATGPLARKTRSELEEGLNNLGAHLTLLELAVTGLRAPKPVPFDEIYNLGFYVPEPLYKVGYVMARALATDEGPQALAAYLGQPSERFVRHYTRLPRYGLDHDHPRLGPNVVDAVELLASGCPGG